VVIASFLFSTIAVAFLGVWGMQARGLEKSRHSLVATMLAEELVEETMAKGYETTQITEGPPEPDEIFMETESRGPSGEWTSIPVTYTSERTVAPIGDPDKDKLKMVTVKVTWDDSTNIGEVVLVTYLAGVF
jgi:hypothetical protein